MALGGVSTATLVLLIKAENKAGAALGAVHRDLAAIPIIAGVAAAGVIGASVKMAADYQKSLTQVANNTTMGTAGIKAMDQTIRQLSESTGATSDSLALGYMHIRNFGFGAKDAALILAAATKSAISTGGDVGDTANVLANVLHEYSMGGLEAAHAMDVLHLSAALGNMTLSQLVDSGGKAIAMAANLGVPLQQVATGLTTLTLHGETAAQAATQLTGMFSKMVNPAKAARTELALLSQRTGIDLIGDFTAEGLKARGLSGVLADLRAARLSATELFKIIPAMRGGLGVQILTGTGTADFARVQSRLAATMAGQTQPTADAFARTMDTLEGQLARTKQILHFLGTDIGNVFLNALTGAIKALNPFLQMLQTRVPAALAAFMAHLGGAAGMQRLLSTAMHAAARVALGLWSGLTQLWGALQRLGGPLAQAAQHLGLVGRSGRDTDHALRAVGAALVPLALAFAAWRVAAAAATAALAFWNATTWLSEKAVVAWRAAVFTANALGLIFRGTLTAMGFAVEALRAGQVRLAAQMLIMQARIVLVRGATMAYTAAQWLLNVAMSANPIGLVIVVIAALVAAVIIAYTQVKVFRDWVNALWSFLSGALMPALRAVAGFLGGVFKAAWDLVSAAAHAYWTYLRILWAFVSEVFAPAFHALSDWLGGVFVGIWQQVTDQVQGFWNLGKLLVGWMPGLANSLKNVLGGALDWVKQKIDGLSGVLSGFLGLLSKLPGMGALRAAVHQAVAEVHAQDRAAAARARGHAPAHGGPAALVDLSAMGRGATVTGAPTVHAAVHHAHAVQHHAHAVQHQHQHAGTVRHNHHLSAAAQARVDAVLHPPAKPRTPEAAAILDFHTAMTRFAGQKGLDPDDVARMAADIAKLAAADPSRAAQLQAQLQNATQRRSEAIAHHGAATVHRAQVVAHHTAVQAAHADTATLLRAINNEIREHKFAQAARDIAHYRTLETQSLVAGGLDPARAAREAGAIAQGLTDALARAQSARPARPVALQDAVDRFKTDLLTLGRSATEHARLLADVTRIKADEIAAHVRGGRVALDFAENMHRLSEHFKIAAAARTPVAPVPRYGALAGETGYGGVTVSFGGAQVNPLQAMVAALREQITHLRAQLTKDDQVIALLELNNSGQGQQLGVLRTIAGGVARIPTPPAPAGTRSAHSVLKAAGSYAPVTR